MSNTTTRHPRCELCGSNPEEMPHCWLIEFYDEDDAPSPELVGMPYAGCRHCPETAAVCDDCDGEGFVYPDYDGDDQDDGGSDDAIDCPTCEGWGVIWPAKDEASRTPQDDSAADRATEGP